MRLGFGFDHFLSLTEDKNKLILYIFILLFIEVRFVYVVEKINTMHRFTPLLYFICWLLHVSAVVCHLQGASGPV
jgi:hypothetical protein